MQTKADRERGSIIIEFLWTSFMNDPLQPGLLVYIYPAGQRHWLLSLTSGLADMGNIVASLGLTLAGSKRQR